MTEESSNTPSLLLLLLAQILTTIGDSFGQRVSRVNHRSSSSRMMMSSAVVSAAQMVVFVGVLQVILPRHITSDVYDDDNHLTECYKEVDVDWINVMPYEECISASGTCKRLDICPSQGVSSIPRQIWVHPALLYNGIMNVFYLVGETLLYREALGLIFIVVAALFSTFLIAPLSLVLGMNEDKGDGTDLSTAVLCLGIVGSLLCVVEYNPNVMDSAEKDVDNSDLKGNRGSGAQAFGMDLMHEVDAEPLLVEEEERMVSSVASGTDEEFDMNSSLVRVNEALSSELGHGSSTRRRSRQTSGTMYDMTAPRNHHTSPTKFGLKKACWRPFSSIAGSSLRIAIPFLMLSVCYCLWFVLMRFYNSKCRSNAWGYNAIDQGCFRFM